MLIRSFLPARKSARLGPRLPLALAALSAAALLAGTARASGPPGDAPWYLDVYGGEPSEQTAFYRGRIGVVLPGAPRVRLFMDWRLLHGLAVGETAGKTLCCGGHLRS